MDEGSQGALSRLGVVGGSAFVDGPAPPGTRPGEVSTDRGAVIVHEGDAVVFVRRHGESYRPPHRVRHAVHALALRALGVEAAVGLCSVGGLRETLAPGTVVVPHDYLSLAPPATMVEGDEKLHIVPRLDADLRSLLLAAARSGDGPVEDGGVYAETRGPRFETRAEVRLLADHADVVGMTAASEATIFQEAGLRYAILCVVDNLAHGIGPEPLTPARFEMQLAANRDRAVGILEAIMDRAEEAAAGRAEGTR